jgi:8-oxo-dGTP diphosphatase
VVYVGRAEGVPVGADDAREAELFEPTAAPAPLAFDHAEILADYLQYRASGRPPRPRLPVRR